MRITFLRPNMVADRASDAMQPLAIAALAGLTPPDVETEFFDECVEELPLDRQTDLVAISAHTFSARRAYEVADRYRSRGVRVVLGGYHPTFLPEEALVHADAVVVGHGEGVWPEVVEDARGGRLRRTYQRTEGLTLEGVPYERSLFRGKKYNPIFPVEFGRGCRFSCEFCSVSAFNRNGYMNRPVEDVIRDIETSGARRILIVDDNIFSNRREARRLFEALVGLGVKWGCQISLDVTRDPELLDLIARSGCVLFMIGFESLSRESLRQMGKGSHASDRSYALAIRRIKDHGIMIYGSFVFGYDHDGPDVFDTTVDFALEHKFALANFNTLNPMPGTRLYDRLREEGRLLDEQWWLRDKYKYGEVMFRPARLTPEELKEGCIRARFRFFRYAGILRRALDLRANGNGMGNLSLFLLANLVARKETLKKMKLIR